MKLEEKIIHLRNAYGYSQEEFANKLDISRQAISRWEKGEAAPTIDKLIKIGQLFNVTLDDLLHDEIIINKASAINERKLHYFGTDGFRGEANVALKAEHAFKIGRFLGWYYQARQGKKSRIVIGKDTRKSSYMLEYAIASGIASSGGDAYIMHVTTSPSVSFITRSDDFDCGVMITASHNPFCDNGIKIISSSGEKFNDEILKEIEAYIDGELHLIGVEGNDLPLSKGKDVGSICDYWGGRNRYIGSLISVATYSYEDMRIGLDSANGASWAIAKSVFDALGAKVFHIGNKPNGTNINKDCGSTHIEELRNLVIANKLDVGFAFDGDADRCLAVDENGNVIDGDKILYILAKRLKRMQNLNHDTIVTTIMSNSGLTKALNAININNVQTNVGDRFVYEKMVEGDFMLGGEQSGHIINRKYATTGDGILTAILLCEEMRKTKNTISSLCSEVTLFPQITKNVKVDSKDAIMNNPDIASLVASINQKLNGEGRVLLRKSGTEPVIRIMCESPNEELCREYINQIYSKMEKEGLING